MSKFYKIIDNVFDYVVASASVAATGKGKSSLKEKEAIAKAGIDYAISYGRGKLSSMSGAPGVERELQLLSAGLKDLVSASTGSPETQDLAGVLTRWFVGLELLDLRLANTAALEALHRIERLPLYSDAFEVEAYSECLDQALQRAVAAATALCAAGGALTVRGARGGSVLGVLGRELQSVARTLDEYRPRYAAVVRKDPLATQGAGVTVAVCLERIAAATATAYNDRARCLARGADPRPAARFAAVARGPTEALLERALVAFRLHADLLYAAVGDWIASLGAAAATTGFVRVAYEPRREEAKGQALATYGDLIARIVGDANVLRDLVRRAAAEGTPATPAAQEAAARCCGTLCDHTERMLGAVRVITSGTTTFRAKECAYAASFRLSYAVATEAADVLHIALFTAGDVPVLARCALLAERTLDAVLASIKEENGANNRKAEDGGGGGDDGAEADKEAVAASIEKEKALLEHASIAFQLYLKVAEWVAGQQQCHHHKKKKKKKGEGEGGELEKGAEGKEEGGEGSKLPEMAVPQGSFAAEAAAQRAAGALGMLRDLVGRVGVAGKAIVAVKSQKGAAESEDDRQKMRGIVRILQKGARDAANAALLRGEQAAAYCAALRTEARYLASVLRETPATSVDGGSVHRQVFLPHVVEVVALWKGLSAALDDAGIPRTHEARARAQGRVQGFVALAKTLAASTTLPGDAEAALHDILRDADALALELEEPQPQHDGELAAEAFAFFAREVKAAAEEYEDSLRSPSPESRKIRELMGRVEKAITVLKMGDVTVEQAEKVSLVLWEAASGVFFTAGAEAAEKLGKQAKSVADGIVYAAECGVKAADVFRAVTACYAVEKDRYRECFIAALSEVVTTLIAVCGLCQAMNE